MLLREPDDLAGDFFVIDLGLGGDFAGHAAEVGGDQRLAGDAAHGVLSEEGVQNAIGDLIGELIRVT